MTSQNATPPTGKEIGQYIDATLRSRLRALVAEGTLPPLRVGNLPTMNQDEYPSLGRWWVQLWAGDEVFARVYGETPQQAKTRAVALASVPVTGEAQPVAWAITVPKEDSPVYWSRSEEHANEKLPDYADGTVRRVFLDAAPQASEAARKQALHQAADLVESFGRDAGAGHHFESSSYEAVVPAAANEISKLIRAMADRPAPRLSRTAGMQKHGSTCSGASPRN
ncbi:hypothetical protein [Achromobacter spanius]